jgi:hypothetical protein
MSSVRRLIKREAEGERGGGRGGDKIESSKRNLRWLRKGREMGHGQRGKGEADQKRGGEGGARGSGCTRQWSTEEMKTISSEERQRGSRGS